jgi:16S rRNA processing protein RimM
MIEKDTVCKTGYFTKPHGVKGEIGLVLSYDIFSHADEPFVVCEMDGILVPFFIETYRRKTDTVTLVKLETVDSEEAVRKFSNREVYYPRKDMKEDGTADERQTSGTGWADFAGYLVSDEKDVLGEITAIDESTANILLQIDREGRELLVPAVEEWITSVDHKHKRLTLAVPEGLLDL